MRGLTSDEARMLYLTTQHGNTFELDDDGDVIVDRLIKRGCVAYVTFAGNVDVYVVATPLGRIALACYAAVRATI